MAFPRRIIAGLTVMITRRTLRRTHLLRPDDELNNFFEQDNPQWPAVATLTLRMPAVATTDALARETVASEVARLETDAHTTVQRKGWRFLGRDKIASLSPYDRAKSWEPLRSRNPQFAVGRNQRAAFFEAVTVLRAFRQSYRAALEAWRNGLREVLFPIGTWFMRWGMPRSSRHCSAGFIERVLRVRRLVSSRRHWPFRPPYGSASSQWNAAQLSDGELANTAVTKPSPRSPGRSTPVRMPKLTRASGVAPANPVTVVGRQEHYAKTVTCSLLTRRDGA